MNERENEGRGLTRSVLPPTYLDELLDVGDFFRHVGRTLLSRMTIRQKES